MEMIHDAVERGIVVVNVTQCLYGSVEMHRYENGQQLERIGVIGGNDITTEAALAKLMALFGKGYQSVEVKELMCQSLRGEITVR